MKLHSLSLIWGVTSEAMEYEEQAEIRIMKMFQEEETSGFLTYTQYGEHLSLISFPFEI